MSRLRKPSAPARPRFPRLLAAWALLGSGVAHSDTSAPAPGAGTAADGSRGGAPSREKDPCPSESNAPAHAPRKPGGPVTPRRYGGVKQRARAPLAFVEHEEGELLLHPHGPDEPCKRRA